VDRDLKMIGGSLFIASVDRSRHGGFWTCQAKNEFGYENKTFKLTVKGSKPNQRGAKILFCIFRNGSF
jgi:hypothetical protein